MGRRRGKVKLQWIVNDNKRRTTFKKRLAGLIKKVSELSILCGIPACIVVYGPIENQPVVWPSVAGATGVLQHFKDLPDSEKCKKVLNQVSLLQEKVDKARVKLQNLERNNRERLIRLLIHDFITRRRQSFDDVPPEIFSGIQSWVDERRQAIAQRFKALCTEGTAALPHPSPSPHLQSQDRAVMESSHALPIQVPLAQVPIPMMAPPPYATAELGMNAPVALYSEPHQGSYLMEVLVAGGGSSLPTSEQLYYALTQAGVAWVPSMPIPFFKPM